jgi:hypothetical protein
MGGILLKMILSPEKGEREHPEVVELRKNIVDVNFIGTPHSGSDVEKTIFDSLECMLAGFLSFDSHGSNAVG